MNEYVVLTAIGPDRPGLIDEISEFLVSKDVNIEDSRMAVLGGEFAIILLASGGKGLSENLNKNIENVKKTTGLLFQVKETIPPDKREIEPSIPHKLHITSLDHPGLVHEITKVLHLYNINIESMDTHVANAPISGTPIFTMRCIINIPVNKKISSIKENLSDLEEKLNIDIEFEAVESF